MINFERKQATWDASVDSPDRGRIMVKATYGDPFPGLDGNDNLEMIWVEPGTFMMGQIGVAEPVHEVTLTEGFYLGKFEVTQAQYEAVMTGNLDGLSAHPVILADIPIIRWNKFHWMIFRYF